MGIPVLGVPVLNHNDLFDRMLRTIDYPVDLLYVVDNGGGVPRDMEYAHLPNIFVADTGYNMGVSASWNLVIKANMDAPWWAIANNDIQIQPGVLARLSETMDSAKGPTIARVAIGNEDWGNHFGLFALNAALVDTVGWFDENLYPIYFEDTDYIRRLGALERRHSGIDDENEDSDLEIASILIASSTQHDGNASWKDVPVLAAGNKRSWAGNVEYFDNKWGVAEPNLTSWRPPSLARLRSQAWHIERSHHRERT